jgi:ABC-type phosphate transport system auxiliary subunit
MALTSQDINQIKTSLTDVVEPRFAETHRRLDQTSQRLDATNATLEHRFGQLKTDFDGLAAATNRKFHAVFSDVSVMREDLYVVKQMVTEHGFRLARLEHRTDEGGE